MSKNTSIGKLIFKGHNFHSSCKKCGCYIFECKYCHLNEYYRHIDDKIKMKENLKTIRNRGILGNILIFK